MSISLRKFDENDIINKINWINNPANNQFLHYDLPLEYEKTKQWYLKNRDREDRFDAVIECNGIPVGLIGLLNIDFQNKKAEYYIAMGDASFKGKGIATKASHLLLKYAFDEIKLNRIYLYTEKDNIIAQRLFEKVGFKKEGLLLNDIYFKDRKVDRYVYGITKDLFKRSMNNKDYENTPIQFLGEYLNNNLYIKREDYIPFSFGGNKARKAKLFFDEIDSKGNNCVVTYGSSSSNHCRVISNMAASRGIPCYVISPHESSENTFNSKLMDLYGAKITIVPVENVHETIEKQLEILKENNYNPYFIAGGGHGNIGTQAYLNCYKEINSYEEKNKILFDYIFFASGTGTTQAGLVCGKLLYNSKCKIIGISIARKNPYGRTVVIDSIKDYLNYIDKNFSGNEIENATIFLDDYTFDKYGSKDACIEDLIKEVLLNYGLPLDSTYTGKAFYGMKEYLIKNNIKGKKILFIHTGGTPLFFNDLEEL